MKMAINIYMIKKIYITALVLIFIITGHACAGTRSHLVNISTRVAPALTYQVLHAESVFAITEADIAKGYVDINRGMTYTVRTNALNGYLVWFTLNENVLKEVRVYSDTIAYGLMRSAGEIHMPYSERNNVPKELSFRFYFSPEVKTGIYDWPVSIMVTAM